MLGVLGLRRSAAETPAYHTLSSPYGAEGGAGGNQPARSSSLTWLVACCVTLSAGPREQRAEMDPDTKARLDKQAAAIRELRAQMQALGEQMQALGEQMAALTKTDDAGEEPVARQGVFMPSGLCVMCHQIKEVGRAALTCKPCGKKWMDGVRGEGPRITFASCGNCGAAKGATTKMLCAPCSDAYKMWKVQH